MPPEREKGLGQPQLRPTPATSPATRRAASTAKAASALPSWKMRRDFSIGWHSKMQRPFLTNLIVPVRAGREGQLLSWGGGEGGRTADLAHAADDRFVDNLRTPDELCTVLQRCGRQQISSHTPPPRPKKRRTQEPRRERSNPDHRGEVETSSIRKSTGACYRHRGGCRRGGCGWRGSGGEADALGGGFVGGGVGRSWRAVGSWSHGASEYWSCRSEQ